MKTLFLIDGAYQEAKTVLCNILQARKERYVPDSWRLIDKYSTKIQVRDQQNDLKGIKETEAKDYLKTYTEKLKRADRVSTRYFCYNYPELEGKPNYIYCIDTVAIDELIDDEDVTYGFLIVRDPQCISDLSYKYEQNGRLNVVPIFLYTDYTYIQATGDQDKTKKWENLWNTYVGNSEKNNDEDDKYQSGEVNYEGVLIFNALVSSDSSFLKIAKLNLITQLKALVRRVKNKNKDLIVVTESERTYLPNEIRGRKYDIERVIQTPENYRKNIFVMMKYHGVAEEDDLYMKIKDAVEAIEVNGKKIGYKCIRADDKFIKEKFPRDNNKNKPSIVYWLATFLCKHGIAIFEKDDSEEAIKLNPNVAFEMGIMQQQGKHVDIFAPKISDDDSADNKYYENEDLFFDIKDCWKTRHKNDDELIKNIVQCVSEYKLKESLDETDT